MKKIISLVVVCAMMLTLLCACDSSDYKKAAELLAAGSYEEAKQMFEALGEYKDSADQVNACDYGIASELMDAKKYTEAAKLFKALGDYEDASEMAKKCGYKAAEAAEEDGKFAEAAELFAALGDYKDAADRAMECSYNQANALLEAADYEAAVELLEALGDYKDSANLLDEAGNVLALSKFVGTWKSDVVDVTDSFAESFSTPLGDDISDYFDFGEMSLVYCVTIDTDGTVNLSVDDDSVEQIYDQLVAGMKSGLSVFFMEAVEDLLREQGFTMQDLYNELGTTDPDEILEFAIGMSVDELIAVAGLGSVEDLKEMINHTIDGYIEDGKLIADTFVMTVEDDVMTLDSTDKIGGLTKELPITLTRVD